MDAARAPSVTINAALGCARDVILAQRGAGHSQDLQPTGLVEDSTSQGLSALWAVAAARTSTAEPEQLDFALGVIVRGLEATLTTP
ncbi:MAG: hypothetical protein ACTIJJ_07835 [Galactobacter sp.]|uniref:hypothetical protein n=1 Tax=Galactobacter sp. TaxID=2676125 RepID=UPI0025BAFF45|nr:hypothetical protein [Galactobacter sp.]